METGSTDKQAFINCMKFYANFLTALNINSPKNGKRGKNDHQKDVLRVKGKT